MGMTDLQKANLIQGLHKHSHQAGKQSPLLKEFGVTSEGRWVRVRDFEPDMAKESHLRLLSQLKEVVPSEQDITGETEIRILSKALNKRSIEPLSAPQETIFHVLETLGKFIHEKGDCALVEIAVCRNGKLLRFEDLDGDELVESAKSNLYSLLTPCFSENSLNDHVMLSDLVEALEQKDPFLGRLMLSDTQHYQANKLIKKINLENIAERKALQTFMHFKGISQGLSVSLKRLPEKHCIHLMKLSLLDLRSRGLGLDKELSEKKIKNNIEHIEELAFEFEKVLEWDSIMADYLRNHCSCWPVEKAFYRGGEFDREIKRRRKFEKDKDIYNPDTENVNEEMMGKGLYLTTQAETAMKFAKRDFGLTKLWLRTDVPILDLTTDENEQDLMKLLSISDINVFKEYIYYRFNGACILYHSSHYDYYSIKVPSVVAKTRNIDTRYEGVQFNELIEYKKRELWLAQDHKVSSQRLDNEGAIKGRPTAFKTVAVNPAELESTDCMADGFYNPETEAIQRLTVLQYTDSRGITKFVAQSPLSTDQEPVFWRVNRDAKRYNCFILEPAPGFLKQQYEAKRKQGFSEKDRMDIDRNIQLMMKALQTF